MEAGVDEVGRGPIAGPVCSAAVILPESYSLEGLTDSKKLSEKKREYLFEAVKEQAVAYGIGWASEEEIDSINILQATFLSMKRAVEALPIQPSFIYVDGNASPGFSVPSKSIVKGDMLVPCISAASILAKVTRDRLMKKYAEQFPEYGFDKHKGYPTAFHLSAIRAFGPIDIHRKSFAPVQELI